MIGIFQDDITDYLKEHLGGTVRVTSKNIICRCPWCEYEKPADGHYHLWMSTEAPIFHCFYCQQSGYLKKLFLKIEGKDKSDHFVDKSRISKNLKRRVNITRVVPEQREVYLPKISEDAFPLKALYVKKRLAFSNMFVSDIKGMVFDFYEFVRMNNLVLDEKQAGMAQFLQTNFVGFVTENKSKIVFRNIDPSSSFRFYKIGIQESQFMDYYKLPGGDRNSTSIVVAEGIFDIFSEHIYDYTNLKSSCKLFAAALSTNYQSLVKSISFHEHLFRVKLHILSDRNVDVPFYRKLKKFNKHLIESVTLWYNKRGKDFNEIPIDIAKIVV